MPMEPAAGNLAKRFASLCNIRIPKYAVVNKAGETYLAIDVGEINDIYALAIEQLKNEEGAGGEFGDRIFLRERKPAHWLTSLEAQVLQGLIADSLTVGRSTLRQEFFQKFIPFLGGEE